jgi:hypothetical protein
MCVCVCVCVCLFVQNVEVSYLEQNQRFETSLPGLDGDAILNIRMPEVLTCGRDSSVGVATRYGLDGTRGSNPSVVGFFRTRLDMLWGQPSFVFNAYQVFPDRKTAGA